MTHPIDATYIIGPAECNGRLPDYWADKVQLALNRMADRTGGVNGGGDGVTTLAEAETIIREYDVGGNAANPATAGNARLEPIEQVLAIQNLGIYSVALPGPYRLAGQNTLNLAAYGRKLYSDAITTLPNAYALNNPARD